MSNTWFTSDTHLGHKRIMEFCPESRGGCTSVEEHDEIIIKNWNEDVKASDTVYLLGDVSWHKADKTLELLSRLNGHVHLIRGNHDHQISKDGRFNKVFEHISDYRRVSIDGHDVIMSHYPMRTWDKAHHGSFMLYGHEHGALEHTPWGRSMDVGIDARPQKDMRLFSWDDVKETLKHRGIIGHH